VTARPMAGAFNVQNNTTGRQISAVKTYYNSSTLRHTCC